MNLEKILRNAVEGKKKDYEKNEKTSFVYFVLFVFFVIILQLTKCCFTPSS